ncbi:DUF554 domain-containing protein [Ectobacillus antri]|uniref:DUF554 domain-containing protein n=1 Tax=Ectobacillus antri TaxID=2486280 RepID=A0ABT6H4A1_9BACI|nr:DUF554 domain-containing protein [Ectobacillus antri]MDG4655659.1 DUF554 domain-containing protein [Ectobacillus antri]MDG5753417.1 DUF554 domain-containing protein [Ectobacillus antri]
MALLGTLVNGVAIITGSLFGLVLRNISERMKATVMQGIGLAVLILGVGMGLKSEQFLIVISSIAIGSAIGEWWNLEEKLNKLGIWIEKRVGAKEKGSIARGFVTATLVYVVGAMAIVGALDSGLRHDHTVLFTKAMLDGISAIIFTSALGIGVMLSAIPVILYQGFIALFATQIQAFVPEVLMDAIILEITAVGGIMIVAIGLNMLEVVKVRVANMLPSLLIAILLVTIVSLF